MQSSHGRSPQKKQVSRQTCHSSSASGSPPHAKISSLPPSAARRKVQRILTVANAARLSALAGGKARSSGPLSLSVQW